MNQPVFYEECLPRLDDVSAFAMYLCRDPNDSGDLVQETMLKAFTNISSYRKGTNARAWLFQICRNTFINSARRKKHELTRDESGDRSQNERQRSIQDYQLRDESFSDEVMEALQAIPNDCQTALLLCDVEGYSYDEIARLTKTRPGTVRSRIFRGRKAMARMLHTYAGEQGVVDSTNEI